MVINLMNATAAIGIIGYGNMGSAIAGQVKVKYAVCVFDSDRDKASSASGVRVAAQLPELFQVSQVIIIAVKPQDIGRLLREIKDLIHKHVIVSIAAGVQTADIGKALAPKAARVIRVMPNIFAKEGYGISCIAAGESASSGDLELTRQIFSCLGKVRIIDEQKMDAVTAVSGSGPGYLAYLLERDGIAPEGYADYIDRIMPDYIQAARDIGLSASEAEYLATNTGAGIVAYFASHSEPPGALYRQVCSKGGTTEAAIAELEISRHSLSRALQSAVKRAQELSEALHSSIDREE
jgi:pyrroline-5-carboxylate reductase